MERNNLIKKGLVVAIVLFIGISTVSSTATTSIERRASEDNGTGGGTEYWALLIAVGVYANNPDENIPFMLEDIDELYDVLLGSSCWSVDHIKVIKGEDATVLNILNGLRWLDRMDDGDDISLVYITTHGFPLGLDIPPYDEDDGSDEALMSYWGFAYPVPPFSFIWDDELNFMLNRLDSKGVCLIVDSCFAGGFDDSFSVGMFPYSGIQMSPLKWMEEFAEDVCGEGRVVVMSSREDEVSWGGGFSPFLIDGLRGYADRNLDGVVTAEEVFFYVEPRCFWQHPTLYDGYPDELPLIDLNPDINHVAGKTNKYASRPMWEHTGNENYGENGIVCGYVTDAETNDPIKNTFVNIQWHGDNPLNMDWNYTRSNSLGFYTINVAEGYVTLCFSANGYLREGTDWFEVKENDSLCVNASLDAVPPETAAVCGYITDETNEPLKDAFVSLEWLDGQGHIYQNYSEGNQLGFYSMNIPHGEIYLNFFAKNYTRERTYRNDAVENETLWVNVSLHQCINVDITKPLKAMYIKNKLLLPFLGTVILGDIDIEVSVCGYWYEPIVVERVEFYIDNNLKNTDTSTPYIWAWDEKSLLKHKHTITVKAYDENELIATKEIQVWKFF